MNILKSLAVKNVEEATRDIPVIDFSAAFAGSPGGLEAVARQVKHASEYVGFFYLAGHGVPDAVIDAAFAASRELHAIPDAEKQRLKLNENNIGYLPVNQSMQGASTVHKATRPNQNESFFISHDRAADHPDVVAGMPLRGRNQWPEGHERMRAAMVRTSRRSRESASACCRCWPGPSRCPRSTSRRPSPTRRTSTCASSTTRRRRSRRRAVRPGPAHRQLVHHDPRAHRGAGPGGAPAVRGVAGAPLIPGTFLVNLGNMMKRWSNDRFLSTPHAVLNESGTDRYSIAFFYSPNIATRIECLPSCTGPDDPPRYPPAIYGDLVLEFYNANYFHRKGYVG